MKQSQGLPYRPCVGIALFNAQGLVWIGRRLPKWSGDISQTMWQMPQGGIDEGESPRDAALRELKEEIGTDRAIILAESGEWLSYELPREIIGTALGGKYCGQRQKWFAMRFDGEESDIDIAERPGHKAEFDAWRWAPLSEVAGLVVAFKRPVYEAVMKEFAPVAESLARVSAR